MDFTRQDYYHFLQLLRENPEFREEVRRILLSEELLTLPDLVRELSASVRELSITQKRTEKRVDQISIALQELAAAQKRTEERVDQLSIALQELAAAQKRTEERVDQLSIALQELAAAQKRTEERVDQLSIALQELAAAQKRTEERVDQLSIALQELAAAQKRTEERVDQLSIALQELAAAQKRTEEEVIKLAIKIDRTRSELAGLATTLGTTLEEEAASVLETVMRQKGYRLLGEATSLRWDGDVDVVLPVEDPQGRRLTVLMESKARLGRREVMNWVARTRSEDWRKHVQEKGYPGPYLVYAYTIRADAAAREAIIKTGIGLMKGEGEVIPPKGWVG